MSSINGSTLNISDEKILSSSIHTLQRYIHYIYGDLPPNEYSIVENIFTVFAHTSVCRNGYGMIIPAISIIDSFSSLYPIYLNVDTGDSASSVREIHNKLVSVYPTYTKKEDHYLVVSGPECGSLTFTYKKEITKDDFVIYFGEHNSLLSV